MEEEMSNLIKYQFAYQASSRLFAAAQDMFDTLAELT
jgi:flagellar hook-associated protein FlgK